MAAATVARGIGTGIPNVKKKEGHKEVPDQGNRINITLSKKGADQLEFLREEIDASTNAEIVRMSLRITDFIVDEIKKGRKFILEYEDGTSKEIKFFF